MRHPTEDQLRAREDIAILDGADRLTCEMVNETYVVETDTGDTYRISPDGERILDQDGMLTDLTTLEARIFNPEIFQGQDPMFEDPFDVPVESLPSTDEEMEMAADLMAERRRVADDCEYYRKREAA